MGRTSLFWERVSHGNASLQLRSVNTADRGRYRCRVSTEQGARDAFIIARVEGTRGIAKSELRCSSQDIYPAPQLWWSTEPPVRPEALKHTTRKRANEQGLYSIESTVDAADGLSEHSYVCAMNSSYGSQTWRASLRERGEPTAEGQQLTIPCVVPDNLHNFTLAWSFTKEDRTALILTFNSRTRHVADNWASRAQVDPAQVMSGDGSLRLRDPDSSAHTGTYSCAFSAPRTHYLVRTRVNVTAPESGMSLRRPSKRSLMLLSRYTDSRPRGADEETTEMQPMRTGGHAEESGKPGVLGS
uniref:Ig-like domain-containing protein n=1 Tax=Scleropages formosus TaxID=113540 RepID=A0A8C9RVT8_SCLFO